jgi:hypothetical protein
MIIILPALSPTDDYSLGDGATRRSLGDETGSSQCYMRLNPLIAGNFESHFSATPVVHRRT